MNSLDSSENIEGAIRVDYLNSDGSVAGSVNGLIMSYHNQSVIFTPFDINKTHFLLIIFE